MNAIETLRTIEESASKHSAEPRFVRVVGTNDVVRQGDVYVALARPAVERGARRGSHQVAVGTTTGSRHVAEGDVEVFDRVGATEQDGPIVVAKDRWTLTHPEHCHVSLPAGTYEVGYQIDEMTRRRVAD